MTTYIILLGFTRLMGRKQISQLTYFDYIVGITIGSIAGAASIEKNISLFDCIISIGAWSILTIIISEVTLKNIKLRLLIDSEPLIIMANGKVIYKNMKKARYNMGDFLMQLRNKDVFNITTVNYAIFEPDGKLSILMKSESKDETAAGIMVDLILDGNIIKKHLAQVNKDAKWLENELSSKKIYKLKQVVYAGLQSDGQFYIVAKDS